jgi:hypothetical protein
VRRKEGSPISRYKFRHYLCLLLLLLLCFTSLPMEVNAAESVLPYQSVVDYNISVSLNNEITELVGKETIIWTNQGSVATDQVYLHLYPNAFREGSTFLAESGGALRGDRLAADGYGEMIIHRLQVNGQDLDWAYVQPDDGNSRDQTLARLDLPAPVEPGESAQLYIEFTVRLPIVFARMGRYQQFVMAGQWFPKVAVYELAGTRGRQADGWVAHQYHGNTEFYADFGRFRVTVEVPATHTVAATGELVQAPTLVAPGRKQYIFEAEGVHDFAWAADNDFIQRSTLWSPPHQSPVRIQLFLQPEHEHLADAYFRAAIETLNRLSTWLAPYPYPVLTLVCPTAGASGAGGMEYPTLVTGWDGSNTDEYSLYIVLVHEIVHQYFYGLVASNEFEEAWLDEGFTSYFEDRIMAEAFGREVNLALEAVRIFQPEPLTQPGWEYSPFSYQTNNYIRGKLVLHEIERRLGWEAMQQVMQEYVQRWQFRHPGTADFQQVLEDVTGQDWGQFFDHYIYGGGMQDYGIERVTTRWIGDAYETEVRFARLVEEPLRLRLRATYEGGVAQDLLWDAGAGEPLLTFKHEQALISLELDPAPYQLILDSFRLNNQYQVTLGNRIFIWFSRFMHWLAQLLGW